MSNRNLRQYLTTIKIIGFLISIILGLISFFVTENFFNSLLLTLICNLISLSLESDLSLSDLKGSIQRKEVEVVSEQRSQYQHQFLKLKLNANNNLDISGIALDNVLADFLQEPDLLRKCLTSLDAKLLFLNPRGTYVSQRAQEEGIDEEAIREKLQESVRRSAKIYEALLTQFSNSIKNKSDVSKRIGGLEIRIFDTVPYCTIFRSDDRMLFGMYLSYGKGFNLAMFEAHKDQIVLRSQLSDHFNTLWRHPKTQYLVRFSNYSAIPSVNAQVFKDLVGLDLSSTLPTTRKS